MRIPKHDFTRDPIQALHRRRMGTIRGTTLGADNGIGAAACLAVLADNTVLHGPLEVLLTVDEEAGMGGAFGLQAGWLEGDILLNTDSRTRCRSLYGLCWWCRCKYSFPPRIKNGSCWHAGFLRKLKVCAAVTWRQHPSDRGNANKLLPCITGFAGRTNPAGHISGGTLRNAIPREAEAVILVAADRIDAVRQLVAERTKALQQAAGSR